jgi:hypothetical protein
MLFVRRPIRGSSSVLLGLRITRRWCAVLHGLRRRCSVRATRGSILWRVARRCAPIGWRGPSISRGRATISGWWASITCVRTRGKTFSNVRKQKDAQCFAVTHGTLLCSYAAKDTQHRLSDQNLEKYQAGRAGTKSIARRSTVPMTPASNQCPPGTRFRWTVPPSLPQLRRRRGRARVCDPKLCSCFLLSCSLAHVLCTYVTKTRDPTMNVDASCNLIIL